MTNEDRERAAQLHGETLDRLVGITHNMLHEGGHVCAVYEHGGRGPWARQELRASASNIREDAVRLRAIAGALAALADVFDAGAAAAEAEGGGVPKVDR